MDFDLLLDSLPLCYLPSFVSSFKNKMKQKTICAPQILLNKFLKLSMCHNCFEFMCATVRLCPEHWFLVALHDLCLVLMIFLLLLLQWSLSLGRRRCDIDVPFMSLVKLWISVLTTIYFIKKSYSGKSWDMNQPMNIAISH